MIPHKNVTINVFDTNNVQKYTGLSVYIQSVSERVRQSYDRQGALKEWIMMSDIFDIQIHDRIEDSKGRTFWIAGAKTMNDMTGKRMKFFLTQEYD